MVAIVTEEFRAHGINIANMEGHAALKQLILPYPLENQPDAYLRDVAEEYYPKFVEMIGARR